MTKTEELDLIFQGEDFKKTVVSRAMDQHNTAEDLRNNKLMEVKELRVIAENAGKASDMMLSLISHAERHVNYLGFEVECFTDTYLSILLRGMIEFFKSLQPEQKEFLSENLNIVAKCFRDEFYYDKIRLVLQMESSYSLELLHTASVKIDYHEVFTMCDNDLIQEARKGGMKANRPLLVDIGGVMYKAHRDHGIRMEDDDKHVVMFPGIRCLDDRPIYTMLVTDNKTGIKREVTGLRHASPLNEEHHIEALKRKMEKL